MRTIKLKEQELKALIEEQVKLQLESIKEDQAQVESPEFEIEIDDENPNGEENIPEGNSDDEEQYDIKSLVEELEKIKKENQEWKEMFNKKENTQNKSTVKRTGW